MMVALHRAEPLELVFRARAEELFIDINDIPVDSGTLAQFVDRGISIGCFFLNTSMESNQTVTIKNFSVVNNNTKITWHALKNDASVSICTVITIVGKTSIRS